jgi:hypothetical protein
MFDLTRLADSKNKYAVYALNVSSGIALLVAAAWFSFNLFSTRDADLPARVINGVTLQPAILVAGKPFEVHVNVTLNKLCPYEVHWSLARRTDGVEVVKIIEPVRQPPSELGTQDLPLFTRYVPATVSPGEYRYLAEVFDLCQGAHDISSARRNIDITIH